MVEKKTDKPVKRGRPKKDKKEKKKKPVPKKPIKKPVKPVPKMMQTQKQIVIVNVPEKKRRAPRREVKPAVPTTIFRTIRQEVLPASQLLPQQDFQKPREGGSIGVKIPNDIRGTLQGEEEEIVKIPERDERGLVRIPEGNVRPFIPGGRPRMDISEEERKERQRKQKRESAARQRERKRERARIEKEQAQKEKDERDRQAQMEQQQRDREKVIQDEQAQKGKKGGRRKKGGVVGEKEN
jgi:hypothetical protein